MKHWMLLLLGSLFFPVMAQATALHPELLLSGIIQKKATEKGGDEIYLAITEFKSNGEHHQYLIPEPPMYWPSSSLAHIKNLSLWKQPLKPGESEELLVSLVEQDLAPWDVDDLIGAVKIKIKNEKGHLNYEWSLLQYGHLTSAMKKPIRNQAKVSFSLKGDTGEYQLMFHLMEQKKASGKKVALYEVPWQWKVQKKVA